MTRQPKTHLQHMRDDPLLVFDEAEDYMFIWKQVHRFLMKDMSRCVAEGVFNVVHSN